MNERAQLVLAIVGFVALCFLLMLRGWRSRQGRQAFLPAPVPPPATATTVTGAVPGLFVGTTFAGRWLDRVAVHGLSDRATARLSLTEQGMQVEREGAAALFVPYADIESAAPGDALAGKVMGKDGLLLVTWLLGGTALTSGFRADEHAEHAVLAAAITTHLPATTAQEIR